VASKNGLIIDRSKFTVSYKGRSCFLGNSKPFQLLERLSEARGNYLSLGELIQDVWKGKHISNEAVQRQASILRCSLKAAGIEDIVIDGSQPDHYRLILR
jgi:DNA-binding winged helix-turn-helix (wHTH) protein